MRSSFRLAAVKDLRKKKKKKVGGRRSNVKADSKSAATCWEIPEGILIEILLRLPGYSLMRFKCVSKRWFSLISSKYFTDLFFKFSSSAMRGRRLFIYVEDEHLRIGCMELCCPKLFNLDSTVSFPQLNDDLNYLKNRDEGRLYFVNVLRGLMYFKGHSEEIRIINLTTRQVLNMSCVQSNSFSESDDPINEWDYFGYDPVNDEYKLLRTISTAWAPGSSRVRSETQVLVLGAGASWRTTKSLTSPQHHHRPYGRGISINGVLYYGAWSHMNIIVLMSFDFHSEEFSSIEFPIEVTIKWMGNLRRVNLMNYQDQVAVIHYRNLRTECILDLWMLEDAGESKWSHKTLVLPHHQFKLSLEPVPIDELVIKGTNRRGEVHLSGRRRRIYRNKKKTYALYDLEKNRIVRSVVLEPPYADDYLTTTLWEDVENIMYLEA